MTRFNPLILSTGIITMLTAAACSDAQITAILSAEGSSAGECSDGADNDEDGLYDCDDEDCEGSADCDLDTAPPETCSSLLLDGVDDRILFGSQQGLLGIEDAFTITAWVLFDESPAEWAVLLDAESTTSNHDGQSSGYYLGFRYGFLEVFYGTGEDADLTTFRATDAEMPTERWVHVAASRDGSTVRMYLDGAPARVVEDASAMPLSFDGADYESDVYALGAYERAEVSPTAFLNAVVSDVAVWGRALEESEVQMVMSEVSQVGGVLSWWPLHEGEGATIGNEADGPDGESADGGEATWVESCPE